MTHIFVGYDDTGTIKATVAASHEHAAVKSPIGHSVHTIDHPGLSGDELKSFVAQTEFPANASRSATAETANSLYGKISKTKSKTLVQGFTTDRNDILVPISAVSKHIYSFSE